MATDLEAELRARLDVEARRAVVPEDFPARIQDRMARRARGRRSLRAIVAAVVVLLVGSAAVIASRVGTPAEHTPEATTSGNEGSWQPLPEAPIDPRFQHAAVWTGQEMIVFGGYGDGPDDDRAPGAAAFDPAAGSWRTLSAPDRLRGAQLAVWTGEEVVAFGSGEADGTTAEVAAYDPATDDWRSVADPPDLGGGITAGVAYAVGTGDEVVVVRSVVGDNVEHVSRAAVYDPAADAWTQLPDAPEQVPGFGDAFWTGDEVILVAPQESSGPGAPSRIVALALDPAAGSWRSLPEPPIGPRSGMLAAWTGRELVLGGGRGHDDAVAFDPTTETWRTLPPAPVEFAGSERYADPAVGQQVVAFRTADPDRRPLVLDVGAGRWTLGPPIDLPELTDDRELPGRYEAPMVSTGDAVLVWGGGVATDEGQGSTGCCRSVGEGLSFTPPT